MAAVSSYRAEAVLSRRTLLIGLLLAFGAYVVMAGLSRVARRLLYCDLSHDKFG